LFPALGRKFATAIDIVGGQVPALLDRIEELIRPQIESLDLALVRLKLFGGRRQVLQIMIERADGSDVSVDDCAAASRAVSPLLDVYDPLDGAYQLEVSSPGIDRPLTRPGDYERFAGFLAKIELHEPRDGRRRYRGTVLGMASNDAVRLEVEGTEVTIPMDAILGAKLVLTDELIAAHLADKNAATPVE
jgi:ribosome maturation factor RimP